MAQDGGWLGLAGPRGPSGDGPRRRVRVHARAKGAGRLGARASASRSGWQVGPTRTAYAQTLWEKRGRWRTSLTGEVDGPWPVANFSPEQKFLLPVTEGRISS